MSTCEKCNRPSGRKDATTLKCNEKDCPKWIHDDCAPHDKVTRLDNGELIWYCLDHDGARSDSFDISKKMETIELINDGNQKQDQSTTEKGPSTSTEKQPSNNGTPKRVTTPEPRLSDADDEEEHNTDSNNKPPHRQTRFSENVNQKRGSGAHVDSSDDSKDYNCVLCEKKENYYVHQNKRIPDDHLIICQECDGRFHRTCLTPNEQKKISSPTQKEFLCGFCERPRERAEINSNDYRTRAFRSFNPYFRTPVPERRQEGYHNDNPYRGSRRGDESDDSRYYNRRDYYREDNNYERRDRNAYYPNNRGSYFPSNYRGRGRGGYYQNNRNYQPYNQERNENYNYNRYDAGNTREGGRHYDGPINNRERENNSNRNRNENNNDVQSGRESQDEQFRNRRETYGNFNPTRRSTMAFNNASFEPEKLYATMVETYNVNQFKHLPVCENTEASWYAFYQTYWETRDKFSNACNFRRVQDAIKCEEVKTLGGYKLQCLNEFENALDDIHRELKVRDPARKEYEAIIASKPNHNDYKAMYEKTHKIVQFIDICLSSTSKQYISVEYYYNTILALLPEGTVDKCTYKILAAQKKKKEYPFAECKEILVGYKELMYHKAKKAKEEASANENSKEKVKKAIVNLHIDDISNNYATNTSYLHEALDDKKDYHNPKKVCWFHEDASHPSVKCFSLWGMNGNDVSRLAKKFNICDLCGYATHDTICPNANKLTCNTCQKPHHALFCKSRIGKNHQPTVDNVQLNNHTAAEGSNDDPASTDKQVSTINNNLSDNQPILGVISVMNKNQQINLLFDTCSTCSLMDEDIARELAADVGQHSPIVLTWSSNISRIDDDSHIVKLNCKSYKDSDKSFEIFFRTIKNLHLSNQKFDAEKFLEHYDYLKGLNLKSYDRIHGLVGTDNMEFFMNLESINAPVSPERHPVGFKGKLGDFVLLSKVQLKDEFGVTNEKVACRSNIHFSYHISRLSEEDQKELDIMEKSVMGLLEHPRENSTSDRDKYEERSSLRILKEKVKRCSDSNHFQVPLLWKDDVEIKFDTHASLKMAEKRLRILEHVMCRQDNQTECENEIRKLIEKGYARELSAHEKTNFTDKSFYVPLFFINQKRLRLIWDLAAKIDGKSVNDFLMRGGTQYNDLLQILIRARENKVIITGDVSEMFHMGILYEDDAEALRFLFRFKGEDEIRHFKMLRLPFGATCSPGVADYLKKLVAEEIIVEMPLAADIIANSTYVDDAVRALDDDDTAVQALKDVRTGFKRGGFNFIKMNSNSERVIHELKEYYEKANEREEKLILDDKIDKILGYVVNFETDMLKLNDGRSKFSKELMEGRKRPTKREVLSYLMSWFDPIGFSEFVKMNMKLVYRKICTPQHDWDREIPQELFEEWKRALEMMNKIPDIIIPRKVSECDFNTVEIWSFGDAGKHMQCGVIYGRFLDATGKVVGHSLLYAKTFVVPMTKERTIPEMELDMSAKLVEMTSKLLSMTSLNVTRVRYFTDSTCVIKMIRRADGTNDSVYCRNRLNTIKKSTKPEQWTWISTELMPADLGTKNNFSTPVSYDNEWFQPKILTEDVVLEDEPTHINNHQCYVTKKEEEPKLDFKLFSSLNRAIFTFQTGKRWQIMTKKNSSLKKELKSLSSSRSRLSAAKRQEILTKIRDSNNEILSPSFEFNSSKMKIIQIAQQEGFCEELKMLRKGEKLPENHWLARHLPFVDEHGIMRVSNRLPKNAANALLLGPSGDCPILLPKEHIITELFIMHIHTANRHSLTKNTIAEVKIRYFIQHINSYVKRVVEKCSFCIRYNPNVKAPLMGDLPIDRLLFMTPAYTAVMTDLKGPIKVNLTRNVCADRWILVYTCLTTRHSSLELISGLDTNSTLLGLQNCINLRGAPLSIRMDCGTNYIGADSEMHKVVKHWNEKLLETGLIHQPIDFIYGPARASHMQGAVERIVGATKQIMNKALILLKQQINPLLNDQTLRAILLDIANLLNNRPLTVVGEKDFEFITPNHFVLMRANPQIVPKPVSDDIPDLKNDWKAVKEFSAVLWENWLKHYLPNILSREKWIKPAEPLKVGDLVLTVDTKAADSWILGKIIEIEEGSKEQVRKVKVKLGKRKTFEKNIPKNAQGILQAYKKESQSVVTRPAIAVYKLNL